MRIIVSRNFSVEKFTFKSVSGGVTPDTGTGEIMLSTRYFENDYSCVCLPTEFHLLAIVANVAECEPAIVHMEITILWHILIANVFYGLAIAVGRLFSPHTLLTVHTVVLDVNNKF